MRRNRDPYARENYNRRLPPDLLVRASSAEASARVDPGRVAHQVQIVKVLEMDRRMSRPVHPFDPDAVDPGLHPKDSSKVGFFDRSLWTCAQVPERVLGQAEPRWKHLGLRVHCRRDEACPAR